LEIASELGISVAKLRRHFDDLAKAPALKTASDKKINLVLDATFFGREYGYLCFSDTKTIVYFNEIVTESVEELEKGLDILIRADYKFASFTLDGKQGFIHLLKKRFPGTPIQMCHFHQKAIIRRYITNDPKTECGQDLKRLMRRLGNSIPEDFIKRFSALQEKHKAFLVEKNMAGKYVHSTIRSAFRSIKTHIPYLFVYKEVGNVGIPNTTNHLEGAFSHLKQYVAIHRGLHKSRKKKAIHFILSTP
jgi:hypothetical protein